MSNNITGRSQAMLVSDAEAAQQSAQAYSQLLAAAQQKQVLDPDPRAVQRVRSIAQALIPQAVRLRPETQAWRWDVHVLRSNQVNAWCMAGGKIAVYTGLLERIQPSDDELAQVLGHEIAHAVLSHQAEKISRVKMQQLGLNLGVIAGAVAGYNLRGVAGLANSLATVGLQLPNSRQAESEADAVGTQIAAQAGFNPQAAIALWEKMIRLGGGRGPEWLSTHPDPQARMENLRSLAQALMPVYLAARQRR